jgi:hypothetical protein
MSEIFELEQPYYVMKAHPTNSVEIRQWRRVGVYFLAILLFFMLMLVFEVFSMRSGHDPFPYLILLFALCALPVILVKVPNGRYSLLVVAGPILFMFYGVCDLVTYFLKIPDYYQAPVGAIFTAAELGILSGLSCLFLGYAAGARYLGRASQRKLTSDWKTANIVLFGLLCIGIGIYATWIFQTSVEFSNTKVNYGSPLQFALLLLGRMLEPIGSVLLSYAYLKTRSFSFLILLLAIAAVKLPLGLILNSKEIGISFILLFLMSTWIYNGCIPLRWLTIAMLVFIFYFPLSYAYRTTLGAHHLSVSKSLNSTDENLAKAMKENEKSGGLAAGISSVAGRNDLKTLMEIIVAKTGKSVRFQRGHTLAELPFMFIPRMAWSEKTKVSVGQLFNREFRISANPNTYISTSFLGEMYWNFGWSGVFIGMFFTGIFWGGIGSITNISEHATVTRVLILVSAIYLLVLRFEAGIAQQIILFLRSTAIILLFHMVLRDSRSGKLNAAR